MSPKTITDYSITLESVLREAKEYSPVYNKPLSIERYVTHNILVVRHSSKPKAREEASAKLTLLWLVDGSMITNN